MILQPLEAFQIYNAMKLHFTQESFDIAKYGYKSKRFGAEAFAKRKDKYFYKRLADQLQKPGRLVLFLAGNFVYNPDIWIGDIIDNESCVKNYQRMKKVKAGVVFHTLEDTKKLLESSSFKDILNDKGDIPVYVKGVMQREINPETAVLYNRLFSSFDLIDKNIGADHIIWSSVKSRLNKFGRFVEVPTTETLARLRYGIRELVE